MLFGLISSSWFNRFLILRYFTLETSMKKHLLSKWTFRKIIYTVHDIPLEQLLKCYLTWKYVYVLSLINQSKNLRLMSFIFQLLRLVIKIMKLINLLPRMGKFLIVCYWALFTVVKIIRWILCCTWNSTKTSCFVYVVYGWFHRYHCNETGISRHGKFYFRSYG